MQFKNQFCNLFLIILIQILLLKLFISVNTLRQSIIFVWYSPGKKTPNLTGYKVGISYETRQFFCWYYPYVVKVKQEGWVKVVLWPKKYMLSHSLIFQVFILFFLFNLYCVAQIKILKQNSFWKISHQSHHPILPYVLSCPWWVHAMFSKENKELREGLDKFWCQLRVSKLSSVL